MVRRVLIDQRQRNKDEDIGDDILAGTCSCESVRLFDLEDLRRIHKIRVYLAETPGGCESLGIQVLDGMGVDLKASQVADFGQEGIYMVAKGIKSHSKLLLPLLGCRA